MTEYRRRPFAAALLAMLAGSVIAGCTSIKGHQGYVADRALVATVAPGVDNRDSVQKTLGRPSFADEFAPDSTWYYVSRDTRQYSFGTPKPTKQSVLIVHFDKDGTVTSVDHSGMEKVARIDPVKDKTPTRGAHTNLFQALFGNIGTMGSAQGGTTADNPTGGGGSGSGR